MNTEHRMFLSSISLSDEEWRDVSNFENLYAVSNTGRVARLSRATLGKDGKLYPFRSRLLSRSNDIAGYMVVGLHKDGKTTYKKVHTIVVESFLGKIPIGKEIDHIDGDKSNNSLSNLRVCSHKENINNPITISKKRQPKHSVHSFIVIRTNKNGEQKIYNSIHKASNDGFPLWGIYRACKSHKEYKGYFWCYGEKTKKHQSQRTR
jgi:hypothetical protein